MVYTCRSTCFLVICNLVTNPDVCMCICLPMNTMHVLHISLPYMMQLSISDYYVVMNTASILCTLQLFSSCSSILHRLSGKVASLCQCTPSATARQKVILPLYSSLSSQKEEGCGQSSCNGSQNTENTKSYCRYYRRVLS